MAYRRTDEERESDDFVDVVSQGAAVLPGRGDLLVHIPGDDARDLAKIGAAKRRADAEALGALPERERPEVLPVAPYSTARAKRATERKRHQPQDDPTPRQHAEDDTTESPREQVLGLAAALIHDVADGVADQESTLHALDVLGRFVESVAKPRRSVEYRPPPAEERREALRRLNIDARGYLLKLEDQRDELREENVRLRARLRALRGKA